MVEVRIQRTFVFVVIESELQSSIDTTGPQGILIFFNAPFPVQILGAVAAFFSQSHHILCNVGSQFGTECNVIYFTILAGNKYHLVFHVSVRLDLGVQVHNELIVLIGGMPSQSTGLTFGIGEVQVLPVFSGCEFHRSGQDIQSFCSYFGECFLEIRSDLCRESVGLKSHFASQQ